MKRKKDVCFFLCLVFMFTFLFSQSERNWKDVVIGYFGAVKQFKLMKIYLEEKFSNVIPSQEKGIASLILAYACHEIDEKDEEMKWFEKYTKVFREQDDNLNFLEKDRSEKRKLILDYKDKMKNGFPIPYEVKILSDPKFFKSEHSIKMNYFSPISEISIKLDISIPCHIEIYNESRKLIYVELLKENSKNIKIPIDENFTKIENENSRVFFLALEKEFRNEKKIKFKIAHHWPTNKFEFKPSTGEMKILEKIIPEPCSVEADEKGYAKEDVYEFYYKERRVLNVKKFRDCVLPNIIIGGAIFAFNEAAIGNLDMSGGSAPSWKANVDGSRKIWSIMAVSFCLRGFYNLLSKKIFDKSTKKKRKSKPYMKKEEYNKIIDEKYNQYKKEVTTTISVQLIDGGNLNES